jgi:hypothetical protein
MEKGIDAKPICIYLNGLYFEKDRLTTAPRCHRPFIFLEQHASFPEYSPVVHNALALGKEGGKHSKC